MAAHGAPESSRVWDLQQFTTLLQSAELYEASLETAELPSMLLLAMDELLQAPEANALQLQDMVQILLQMISAPDRPELSSLPRSTLTTLQSAQDWAVEMLLSVQGGGGESGDSRMELLRPQELSASLQQMQTKLFAAAPCRQADVQMELHQSLLAAVQSTEEDTLPDVLDMCATSLENDAQFLQFAEAALSGEVEYLAFGNTFLHRLLDRRYMQQADKQLTQRRRRRLFDALTLSSKIRVWANHHPSWRSQIQTWMLEAHRKPFLPIGAVLPDGWWAEDELSAAFSCRAGAVSTACRRYSHLYATLVDWCRSHVDSFASCRSMELVSALSQSTRQDEVAAQLFNRQLLSHIPREVNGWSAAQRIHAFAVLGTKLEKLQHERTFSDVVWQYEWIGAMERPYLLHEALETVFSSPDLSHDKMDDDSDITQLAPLSAARFFGWFYSYSTCESADEIAALLKQMAMELMVPNLLDGAQWLRRRRADFGILPILRIRLVWFWLLKSIEVTVQSPASLSLRDVSSAAKDILESLEYIFRRFTPPRAKRVFQVELVTQLIVELEWRAAKSTTEITDSFLEEIEPLCNWLTKIVRLMQLEEQTALQKDSRRRNGHRSAVNDVEILAERLDHFYR